MKIVLSAYPDKEKAEEVATNLVEKELAACVNVIKVENSIYKWKGKIEKRPEYLLVIKTTEKAYKQLEMYIKQNHPYKVAEILKIDVEGGNTEYIQWIEESVLSKLLRVPLDFRATKRISESAKKPRTLSL
ncbi:divalent-cation tolerance protein CutA [Candidatus Micrarchaeota archaeon]|nr:divalent-cation tolerance protein CutA [Candidatus Micrarchaeota archaeon]